MRIKTGRFELRLTPEMKEALNLLSERKGKSRAEIIEDYLMSEYAKLSLHKSEGIPSVAGA